MTTLELSVALEQCEDELGKRHDRASSHDVRGAWLRALLLLDQARGAFKEAVNEAAKRAAGGAL